MKVNFSVNNQLATPAMHAASLFNRPAPSQPGRVFIDTDIPSTGMYRDNGAQWTQIAAIGGPEVDTLQSVTDRGNTTNQNLVLTYSDDNSANKIDFFNIDKNNVDYTIEKRGTGVTTNDILVIQSVNNVGPGPLGESGFAIDGNASDIFTFRGSGFVKDGLYINFQGHYYFGDFDTNRNGTNLIINDLAQRITFSSFYNSGLELDFGNNFFVLGKNAALFYSDDSSGTCTIGDSLSSGNLTYLRIDDQQQVLSLSGNLLSGTSLGFSGDHLMITIGGTPYKIKLENP